LARAEADLEAANVLYPFAPGFEDAKKGLITSGNIPISDPNENWLENWVIQPIQNQPNYKAYVFSCENIFWCMNIFFSEFEKYSGYLDFEIVLCLREPFDMIASVYQQHAKRNGATISFSDYIEQQDFKECHASQSLAIIEQLEELRVKVNVLNYTSIGHEIGSRVLKTMGIHGVASGHIAEGEIVNRSLDAAELGLILLINSVFGADAGMRVSDALVNGLPNLTSFKLTFPEDHATIFTSKMQRFVDKINQRLPEDEQLSLEPSACHEEATRSHLLNSDQAEIAYSVLVDWYKDVLASSSLNSDGLIPVAYFILLFLLGNSSYSKIPIDRQTFSIITEECQAPNDRFGLCDNISTNQLLGYFDYFPKDDHASLPQYILISQKLNALTHAGFTPTEVSALFVVVHRVKLRAAIG